MLTPTQISLIDKYVQDHSWKACYKLYLEENALLSSWLVYESWDCKNHLYDIKMDRMNLVEEIINYLRDNEKKFTQTKLC
jgi:hypothetical protein